MQNPWDKNWRLDRRIPAIVILTLVIQMSGIIIWATELNARVYAVEQQSISSAVLNEKFARLEERLDAVKQNIEATRRDVEHINNMLDER